MSTQQVTFTLDVPEGVSQEDLLAWLKFELGAVACLAGDNQLVSESLTSLGVKDVRVE